MGRKRKKLGRNLTAYISADLHKEFEEYARKMKLSKSDMIEVILRKVLYGQDEVLKLADEKERLSYELSKLKMELESAKKENEHLKKKVAKLELELEKWREKWGGQKTLTKWSRKTKEIKELVEQLIPHIEEGLTWREVLVKLGILDLGDRMDILHKLYKPVVTRFGKKEGYLVSQYIKDYVLVKNGTAGYDNYVFKSTDEMPTHLRSTISVEVSV